MKSLSLKNFIPSSLYTNAIRDRAPAEDLSNDSAFMKSLFADVKSPKV